MAEDSLTYAKAAALIDAWLPISMSRWFEAKDLWQEFNTYSAKGKHSISQVLYNYSLPDKKILENRRGQYRYIDTRLEKLDWTKADTSNILDIRWPYGLQDNTTFDLDDNITLYPGSIVVISGVSNMGKTTFMLNLIARNMDHWNLIYLTNEMGTEEFADRVTGLENFYSFIDEAGNPKFEVAARYDNYQDVIIPDGFNIIDYLDPGEKSYMVGEQIDAIKQRLTTGVVFIALQKKLQTVRLKSGEVKDIISDYGTGGQYSEHRARVVLHIEKDHLYVKKAKKCRRQNLGGRRFVYQIIENGSQFFGIHEMIKGGEEE